MTLSTTTSGSSDCPFTFAFQPILNTRTGTLHAYEALVRGLQGESASSVLGSVGATNLADFDRQCRTRAIALACQLGLPCSLNLNLLPSSFYRTDEALSSIVRAAENNGLSLQRIVLEISETEIIENKSMFHRLVDRYRRLGLQVAIDDFGSGYSGLNLLADFQPDQLKLDCALVRGIDTNGPRQAIARAITLVCGDLGIDLVAEGVETAGEFEWLTRAGVHLLQGYYIAQPGFESLPPAGF